MPRARLLKLARAERDLLQQIEKRRAEISAEEAEKLGPEYHPFAPLTAGVLLPGDPELTAAGFGQVTEPVFSAIVQSDASAEDLRTFGGRVRAQTCDLATVLLPASAVRRFERSTAVRFVELSRPWFWDLGQALSFAQIDTLQAAGTTGAGVVVGVIDSPIDVYHPDFRDAANNTRLLFLWVQNLTPQAGEAGPPVGPALPGFIPALGTTYGVEYSQATINAELTSATPYQTVRHQPPFNANGITGHGTFVAGCAAGNGLGGGAPGAAPGSTIIFVRPTSFAGGTALGADSVATLDAFAYVFARAAQAGMPAVVNLSASDNQGPHDGTTLGEQFLDGLLQTPGRAITLSSGNSTGTNAHGAGTVPASGTANVVLNYAANALNSDDIEIWYDGHDRFNLTLTVPTAPLTSIGPVVPGTAPVTTNLPGGVSVVVDSRLNDPRNGDNFISVIINVPVGTGQTVPAGNWTFALAGTTVINGAFHAWVDRNNRGQSAWQAPFLQETSTTLGVPSTARLPITVGNHLKTTTPPPAISGSSGLGPTRDGRIKPEIATVGTNVTAPSPRDMSQPLPGQLLYQAVTGTSFSAPIVAGACALLFQCRGATATSDDLKRILEDTAATGGLGIPSNAFGFGYLQMGGACTAPARDIDVWLRDDAADTGAEPYVGPVSWACPDIQVLDTSGNPVANPTYSATNRFNNIIRVTVRNRGTQTARNIDVYLHWADPGTNIPFPNEWHATGMYTGSPGFTNLTNRIVIPQLGAGGSTTVDFGWAPPAPGSSLAGDSHFCLLVRLEQESDPSDIATGGFGVITASNNLGLRNVAVQP